LKTSLIYFFLFIFISISCTPKEFKVVKTNKNGITIVKNPNFPKDRKINIRFEHILTLGQEDGDENYQFHKMSRFALDSEKNIYVLDRGNCRVQVFDSTGYYLNTIGKKGKGPGEFMVPLRIIILNDTVYVSDVSTNRITKFNRKGKYITSFNPVKNYLVDMQTDSKYLYVRNNTVTEENNRVVNICKIFKLTSEGVLVDSLSNIKDYAMQQVSYSNTVMTLRNHYYPDIMWQVDSRGFIYLGDGLTYTFSVFDTNMTECMKNEREVTLTKLTSKYRKKEYNRHEKIPKSLLKQMDFPEYLPLYEHILMDDKDNLWVQLFNDNKKIIFFDIFNSDGVYIAKVEFNESPLIIKDSYCYARAKTEAGFDIIKKYKIHWEKL